MPHSTYGPPSHVLEVVTFTLRLPSRRNGHQTRLELAGSTETKRGPLFHRADLWGPDEAAGGLPVVDHLTWLALACVQDRPNTPEAFAASLTPGASVEAVPLF